MYLAIDRDSTLYQLLRDFLSAYERRTDVLRDTSEAAFQTRIDTLTQDLKTSTDTVDDAIKSDKGEQ